MARQVQVASFRDPEATEPAITMLARDVTVQKQAEDGIRDSLRTMETLVQEMHQRIKNNLQAITSLLNLHAAASVDPPVVATFGESERRVRAMALTRETLYSIVDFARKPGK